MAAGGFLSFELVSLVVSGPEMVCTSMLSTLEICLHPIAAGGFLSSELISLVYNLL
jgi:hypothetical protein